MNRIFALALSTSLALVASIQTVAFSASFDCNKASTAVEKLICGDAELSTLDEDMALVYKGLRATLPEVEQMALLEDQRKWIQIRGKCDSAVCIARTTAARKAELEQQINARTSTGDAEAEADALAEAESDAEEDASEIPDVTPPAESTPVEHAVAVPPSTRPADPVPASVNPSAEPASATPAPIQATAPERAEPLHKDWRVVLIAAVFLFLASWIGSAWAMARNGQSKVISIGGGFVAGLFLVAGVGYLWVMLISDNANSATESPSDSESRELLAEAMTLAFDPSKPQEAREGLIRTTVAGKWHTREATGLYNYDLRLDGTYSAEYCMAYGEISERQYREESSGTWEVREKRYRDSGKIYYAIHLSGDKDYIDRFIFDRDNALVRWQGAGDGAAVLIQGNNPVCAYPEEG